MPDQILVPRSPVSPLCHVTDSGPATRLKVRYLTGSSHMPCGPDSWQGEATVEREPITTCEDLSDI